MKYIHAYAHAGVQIEAIPLGDVPINMYACEYVYVYTYIQIYVYE